MGSYKVVHMVGEVCGSPRALLSACGLLWSTSLGATRDSYTIDSTRVTCGRCRALGRGVAPPMPERFYIQDQRTIIGNCARWWGPDRAGYTCNLDKAGRYTAEQLKACCLRDTDKAWPVAFVDGMAQRHVHTDGLREPVPRLAQVPCSAANPCCPRVGEYNGYNSDGPSLFECPKKCPCHD